MNNYDWLISKLDAFIRKYYANKVLRGTLIFLTCLLFFMLTVSLSEYYFYMPVWLKVSLVSLFVLSGLLSLSAWVIIPLFKMARLGATITHEQAAQIIGTHFPDISDKLLNILQLKKNADGFASRELIEASIDQKAKQISIIPITTAIDFSKNKKYLPYLLPLVAIGIVILIFAPSIFIDASERLLQPTKEFTRPAPFRFAVVTNPLQALRNTDFTVEATTNGSIQPADMFIVIGKDKFPMTASGKGAFQYTLKNVSDPVQFKLYAAGFYSQDYELKVVPKPVLKAFSVQINYPAYTGRKNETRKSIGDMTLPAGTQLHWALMAEYTDAAFISFGNGPRAEMPGNAMMFGYNARFLQDTAYTIALLNRTSGANEAYTYQVHVIQDEYPVVQVQEFKDSLTGKQILLTGTAGDDYGISRVLFHYQVTDDKNRQILAKSIPLNIVPGGLTTFQHYFDVQLFQLQPGQKLNYFIEAWDNDGVHGSKATRSEVMTYTMLNMQQLDSAINASAQQISSGLSNSSQQNRQLQNELKDMQRKMLQSDKLDWEQQQSLQELADKQQQLQQQLEETKKRFEEQIQQSKQKEYSEDFRDKQDELQKQMDNLLNNELKEQMKKLQELMAKLNKDNAFQTMQQMEQENKLFNMDLERMKELMKKLEMQMRMEDMANKMDQLAKDQQQLKKETDQQQKTDEALGKEQQNLKQQLDEAMKKDMNEMKDLNKEMKQQQDLADIQQQGKDAQKNMKESEAQLEQQQNSKSSKAQQEAVQNLQEMANSLRSAAGGMEMEQLEMDIRAVRQILTNLIRLSFDQEKLMAKVKTTSPSDQAYLTNQQEQNRLHTNSLMIRDSLFELSKKHFKLAATVNQETTELEHNMKNALEALEDRRIGEAMTRQQYVMTRTNNLALMLNEMLSNLMQMQSQAMQSKQKGSCNNPGGMKPKPGMGQQLSDMITKQKQLGDAMQQMEDAMQKRQGQGKPKDGQQQGQSGSNNSQQNGGEYGNAEQLARMAEQQAAIRRQLQQLQSLMNSKGMGNGKEMQEMQQKMDRTETDLVNRRLSSELLLRQREILTRLLETEKAVREQEQDDKRSSKTPQEIARPIPAELQNHLKERQNLLEVYKTIPPQLKPYYKTMVDAYFKMIGI